MRATRKFTDSQKKVIYFIAGIIGEMNNPKIWEDFHVHNKMQTQISRVIAEAQELIRMFVFNEEEYKHLRALVEQKEYIVGMFSNTEFVVYDKKYRAQSLNVKREDFFDLMSYACEHCKECTANPKKCKLRRLLKQFNIPKYDPEGCFKCEYCLK